jgi:hypothetical protein
MRGLTADRLIALENAVLRNRTALSTDLNRQGTMQDELSFTPWHRGHVNSLGPQHGHLKPDRLKTIPLGHCFSEARSPSGVHAKIKKGRGSHQPGPSPPTFRRKQGCSTYPSFLRGVVPPLFRCKLLKMRGLLDYRLGCRIAGSR